VRPARTPPPWTSPRPSSAAGPRSRTERISVKGRNPILSVSEIPPAPARATTRSISSSSTRSRRDSRAVMVDRYAVLLRDEQRYLEAVAVPSGALVRPRERGDRWVSFQPQSDGGLCAATWSDYREVRRRSTAGKPATSASATAENGGAPPASPRIRSCARDCRIGDSG